MRKYFCTNCLSGHWNKLVILEGEQLQLLPSAGCRATQSDKFLPAHVSSHHVAQSQYGAMLCLRALKVTNTQKTF